MLREVENQMRGGAAVWYCQGLDRWCARRLCRNVPGGLRSANNVPHPLRHQKTLKPENKKKCMYLTLASREK